MATYKGQASEAQRAVQLMKKRDKEKEELETRKKKIEESNQIARIDSKFQSHYDAVEQTLKSNTIGLVTLDEMKAKQELYVREREKQMVRERAAQLKIDESKKKEKLRLDRKNKAALSFDPEDEEEEENEQQDGSDVEKTKKEDEGRHKRIKKNPDVDTSFLPDKDREEQDNKLKEQFRLEWVKRQDEIKKEEIEITYSYWDGAGHRRQVRMRKGQSIHDFLHRCLLDLRAEFPELRASSVDSLMYIKEDLIIPQHYTFYDFIVTKARGKSGPLFSFDVKDDVRLFADATVEKEETHAGKVTLRSWYEKNKHTFPACRWEPYDPSKKYEKYTISDKMVGVK